MISYVLYCILLKALKLVVQYFFMTIDVCAAMLQPLGLSTFISVVNSLGKAFFPHTDLLVKLIFKVYIFILLPVYVCKMIQYIVPRISLLKVVFNFIYLSFSLTCTFQMNGKKRFILLHHSIRGVVVLKKKKKENDLSKSSYDIGIK